MTNPRYHTHQWRTTTRQAVLAKTGGRCLHCGWPGHDGKGAGIHIAHIVEPELGGTDTPENLIPLCPTHHRGYDAHKQAARTTQRRPAVGGGGSDDDRSPQVVVSSGRLATTSHSHARTAANLELFGPVAQLSPVPGRPGPIPGESSPVEGRS